MQTSAPTDTTATNTNKTSGMNKKEAKEDKAIKLEVISAKDLQGQVLKTRYMISHPLDEGCFGNIYECVDLNKPKNIFVIKVSSNYEMLGKEIQCLSDIKNSIKGSNYLYPYDYVPKCVSKGMFLFEEQKDNDQSMSNQEKDLIDISRDQIQSNISSGKKFMSYFILQKYGNNLDNIFNQFNMQFSMKTICQIGIRLINIMQVIHEAGYIYNDMKLDNILIGDYKGKEDSMHNIRLIDFGFASKYQDKNGQHLPLTETQVFRSNMIFASINQFNFYDSSRRDDMMALCYMLIFMFNQGSCPFIAPDNLSKRETFEYIKNVKQNIPNAQLVGNIDSSGHFLQFINQIFSLKFEEEPNYQELINMLKQMMFSNNIENDNEFDWNKSFVSTFNGDQMKFQQRIPKEGNHQASIFQSVASSIQPQIKSSDFDLDCDLELDDLDDNKILTQNYTSDLQNQDIQYKEDCDNQYINMARMNSFAQIPRN